MRIFAIALALSSVAIPATVSAQQQTCAPREDVAKAVESGRLRLMAQALDGRGNLLQFLMNPSDLSWAAWVTVPGSPDSCAAFGGPAWLDEPPPPVAGGIDS